MPTLDELLHDLRPRLHYDRAETLFADAAEVMIGNDFRDGPCLPYATRLVREGGEELAAAGHADPARRLGLEFLRPDAYPTGEPVRDDDHLDPGLEWVADGRRGHSSEGHANRVYGRIAPSAAGGHWLQYWLFYFASTKGIPTVRSATGLLGLGLHPGDWEMIQLFVPEGGSAPTRATFAAHDYAFKVDPAKEGWDAGIPDVYVAVGSHASYPRPGRWKSLARPGLGLLTKLDDRCSPGQSVRPDLIPVEAEPWLSWPGRWGKGGPRSPARQDQWTKPDRLHEKARDISDGHRSGTLEEALGAPPQPFPVTVERVGDRVTIAFDVPPSREDAWAAALTIAVDPGGEDLPVSFVYDVTEPGSPSPA